MMGVARIAVRSGAVSRDGALERVHALDRGGVAPGVQRGASSSRSAAVTLLGTSFGESLGVPSSPGENFRLAGLVLASAHLGTVAQANASV